MRRAATSRSRAAMSFATTTTTMAQRWNEPPPPPPAAGPRAAPHACVMCMCVQFVIAYNKKYGAAVGGLDCYAYISQAPIWRQTEELIPSAVRGVLLSLALAYLVLVIAAHNYIAAALAILNIGMIVTIIFGFMYIPVGLGL